MTDQVADYPYRDADPTWANSYLWPSVRSYAQSIMDAPSRAEVTPRAFDLECGSGATANMLAKLGFDVTGIDTSESGIALARSAYPACRFEVASAYDDLAGRFGSYHLVVSLEVIEHLYDPRRFVRAVHDLLGPGGTAIISTPYHGYLKNLALAVTGKLDDHFTALWDGGHIKFFSIATLRELLTEAGLQDIRVLRVGRIPPLAKSMIAIARRPLRPAGKHP